MDTTPKGLAPTPATTDRLFVALILDVRGSSRLPPKERWALQQRLLGGAEDLNRQFADALWSKFGLGQGDEMQAVLHDGRRIQEIIWRISAMPDVLGDVRFGIGLGEIRTPRQESAVGMDGEAFWMAKAALRYARKKRQNLGVYAGFGASTRLKRSRKRAPGPGGTSDGPTIEVMSPEDRILTQMSVALESLFARLKAREARWRAVTAVRRAANQREAATAIGISTASISNHLKAGSWWAYLATEEALNLAIAKFHAERARGTVAAEHDA